jgi:hypothetical protein
LGESLRAIFALYCLSCRVTGSRVPRDTADTTGAHVRKVLLTIIGGLLTAAWLTSPAHATKPVVLEDVRFDGATAVDPFLSDACGFEVSVSTTGHFRATRYFDKDGNVRLETGHPSLSDTLTSPYGSIETSDRGLDKFSVNPDGTLLIFGTGIHLKVKGQVYAIGLWRLTFDEAGELINQEYHGRFDVQQPEIIDAICSLLGPGGA